MNRIQRAGVGACAAAAAIVGAVLVPMAAQASGQYTAGSNGIDLSFPSCGKPIPSGDFRIVGVNGGSDFTDNGCAAAEAAGATNVSIYVNTGLNTTNATYKSALSTCGGEKLCAAKAYGKAAGEYAVASAKRAGLDGSATWWLDVETTNPWSSDTAQNVADIQAQYDAIVAALTPAGATGPTATVGVYARPGQWSSIAGTWRPGWPAWSATGARGETAAQLQQVCAGTSFTGGPIQVVQWIGSGHLNDLDYGC